MGTTVLKRKNIDLPEEIFQALSVAAAVKGTNLKKYIEELLIHFVKDNSDEMLYEYLLKTDPEGREYVNPDEKKDFEQFLADNV